MSDKSIMEDGTEFEVQLGCEYGNYNYAGSYNYYTYMDAGQINDKLWWGKYNNRRTGHPKNRDTTVKIKNERKAEFGNPIVIKRLVLPEGIKTFGVTDNIIILDPVVLPNGIRSVILYKEGVVISNLADFAGKDVKIDIYSQ